MRQQFFVWFYFVLLMLAHGAVCQEPEPDLTPDLSIDVPADGYQQKFDKRLEELTAQYWVATAAIDDKFVEEGKRRSQQLVDALEEARKKAMVSDVLDDALHFDELKKQYLAWVPAIPTEVGVEPSAESAKIPVAPSEPKRPKEPSAALVEQFNKDIKALASQRNRALGKLDEKFLEHADETRKELVSALETLRREAMTADDMASAVVHRDRIRQLSETKFTVPSTIPADGDQQDDSDIAPIAIDTPEGATENENDAEATSTNPSNWINVFTPFSDGTRAGFVDIPANATRVEVTFFADVSQPFDQQWRSVGYNGILKIDGKVAASYRKAVKGADGNRHSVSVVLGGEEIVSSDLKAVQGTIDITSLVTPGTQSRVLFSHGQRSKKGLRMRIECNEDKATEPAR